MNTVLDPTLSVPFMMVMMVIINNNNNNSNSSNNKSLNHLLLFNMWFFECLYVPEHCTKHCDLNCE